MASGKALTPRQAQILELVAAGLADKEIASRLGLSLPTVRSHLQRLYRDHGFKNRADAAVGWIAYRAPVPARPTPEPEASDSGSQPIRSRGVPLALPIGAALALALGLGMAGGGVILPLARGLGASQALHMVTQSGPAKTAIPRGNSTTATASPRPGGTAPSANTGSSSVGGRSITQSAAPAKPVPKVSTPTVAPPAIQVEAALGQLQLVNHDRASALLPALQWNACLASAAAQAAHAAAQAGNLAAAQGGSSLGCAIGGVLVQNLGSWPTVNDAQMNAVFMADPLERARILGASHAIGAAWAHTATGTAFLVVDFA